MKEFLPQEVTAAEMAFGGGNLIPYGDWQGSDFMPSKEDIPEEYRQFNRTTWSKVAEVWFFKGLYGYKFIPRKGIDEQIALRHLSTIMGSYTPKHEHKIAAVAYLMSLWFKKIKDDKGKVVAGK
jgi:hypothetical protein